MFNNKKNFILKCIEVHGDVYDYSQTIYVNVKTKVKITCPDHGEFFQLPNNHLRGSKCPKCNSNSRRKTKEDFVLEATKIHGDLYDYSLVEYVNVDSKVKIICSDHGIFEQTPYNHTKRLCKCPKCQNRNKADNLRYEREKTDTDLFIKNAVKIHSNKYDYSQSIYIEKNNKIKIICPKHGEFYQLYHDHIYRKSGCPTCSKENYTEQKRIKNKSKLIDMANNLHHNKYDYSFVEYIDSKKRVKIICPIHGEFKLSLGDHIYNKRECPKCTREITINRLSDTTEIFIEKAKAVHGDLYDYELVNYTNINNKIKIICETHGEFEQRPGDHLYNQSGCPHCKNKYLRLDDEFIDRAKKIHNNKYDYSLVDYINIDTKVKIICPEHGIFEQTPYAHMVSTHGCRKCSNFGISKMEKQLLAFIIDHYFGSIVENDNKKISPYHLDIYLPDDKIAFEFNGLYWHSEQQKETNYHLLKTQQCEERGIHLIHIFEDQWLYKQDIVKSRILNILGCSQKIYAKSTEIREVSYNDSFEFLNSNHIQGSSVSKYRYGLYLGEELVSIMTVGSMRKNVGSSDVPNHYELLRFCNKMNTTVVGGASKLFKHFLKEISPEVVISYADRSWTMNNDETLYHQLGFEFKGETRPNYYYIIDSKRENRFKHRKSELVAQGFDENKSEKEIMLERNIFRIYDSGQLKFSYKK